MKKKYVIIALLLVILVAIGIGSYLIFFKKDDVADANLTDLQKNIEGQYSDVVVTDFNTAKESIEDVKEDLKVASVEEEFAEGSVDKTGDVLDTYKLKQIYKGVEVYNSGLIVYTDKERKY